MSSLTFELGDVEYEVETSSYTRGHSGSYWEPPEGGEIELCPFVALYVGGEHVGDTTFDVFVLEYAVEYGVSLERADERIHDACLENEEQCAYERED